MVGRKQPRWRMIAASLTWILLVKAGSAAAMQPRSEEVSKFALEAYCVEAKKETKPLAEGRISYQTVADLASERALKEHPDVRQNRTAWKTTIVAVLDQYGDEPTKQLCHEHPGS
jgi:hypothetical protein